MKSWMRIFLFVFLLAFPLYAQQPGALPEGMQRLTSVEGITEYRLANGLKILLFPDPTKQTITVNITYLVGSVHENYGETGMAHLLEHLVFKGTPRHPNIPQELTEHGTRPNGTTWWDRTNYYETFAATEENLQWALDLEADRMVNSHIAKKDLDSEMTVVRNEFEAGENSPFWVLIDRMMSTAYLWHNYGKSTIGARSDIENVPIDRLQAFYRKHYQPDNAVLLVAGRFDEEKTLQLIHKYFSPIPKPQRVLQKIYTTEPAQDGERRVSLQRVGDVQYVAAAYHVPPGSHPDYAALDILIYVLGDTPAGRLHKALVETKQASSIFGMGFQLREPGICMFGAELRQESSLDTAQKTLLETIDGVRKNPPTKEEVERARTALLKNIELALNSPDRVGLELSEWIAMGDWRLFFLHRDRLRKVTPEDVRKVAENYFTSTNRTLGMFIPTSKPDRAQIPAVPDITAMLKDYKGDATVEAGEAFDPSIENIATRLKTGKTPGGIEISMLPKKTRGGSVVARLVFRFGDEKSLMSRSTAAAMAGAMLMRGTQKRTRQQIQDEFDRLKARVSVSGGATQAGASIETLRENLPDVLKLVHEILTQPSFPETEFEQLKQEHLAAIEQQRSEPEGVGFTAFERHLNPYPKGDVRYVETIDESIALVKAANLNDAKQFYKEFYGASNGQVAVIGDFDEKQVTALVSQLFDNWKSPAPFQRVPTLYHDVPPVNEALETPDKANAVLIAGHNMKIRDDDPDYPALVLGNYMLGGGFLNSRLATRIRQKEGLSYGVDSSVWASSLDHAGTFTAYAIFAPANAAKLEAVFKEEVDKVLKDGFTPEEVAAAKSGILQGRQVSRSEDRELVGKLLIYLYIDREIRWDAEFEKKIQALTPQAITEALRKHIDPAKLSIVKAGDF